LKLLQKPYDAYIKGINGRFALPITYLIARLKRKPFILWTGIWMRLQTPAHRFFFPLTRYIYRHADAIVVYGEHVKRYLLSEGVAPERIFIAAHAMDNEAYNRSITEEEQVALRQRLQLEPQDKIVLYLGRLEAGKGVVYLLQAAALTERSDTVLLFAGTGSEQNRLQALTEEYGLSQQVQFAGYVPIQQAIQYYAIADIFVLPSITTPVFKEPWGLVVNEAFNQGLPVIATDAVGAAGGGLVIDGVNGLIVPEKNSAALANAMASLLDDEQLRRQLGQNARHKISEWDNERMVQGFREALRFTTSK
jgi:glycosyltransferase involved in cell wall biosynthesis